MSQRFRSISATVAAIVTIASCGGSDETSENTTDVSVSVAETSTSTTDAPVDTTAPVETTDAIETRRVRAMATSADGEISVEATASEPSIWLAVDSDNICSPAEPAVSVIEAVTTGDVGAVRGRFVNENGNLKVADFSLDDDGTWKLTIGPVQATRSSRDAALDVTVLALPTDMVETRNGGGLDDSTSTTSTTLAADDDEFEVPDGAAAAVLELEVLAPQSCGDDQPNRRKSPTSVTVEARLDTSLIVGGGVQDCLGRPTGAKLAASTTGKVVAVEVSATLPTGQSVAKSFTGGPQRWNTSIGPFPATSSMPAMTVINLQIRAIDGRGDIHSATATLTLSRPEPCEGATTTTTTVSDETTTTAAGIDSLSVSTTPAPLELWATASGLCPAGPTTGQIAVSAPAGVTGVTIEVRAAGGTTTTALQGGGGSWTGSIGPFTANQSMPATSDIDIRITATGGSQQRTTSATGKLRRPDACGSGSTTTPPATTTTVAPTTTTPTTTTPTTTTPTTTTTTTTPPPLGVQATASSPVWAVADGFCPGGATTLTIQARTTGGATQVGAQVTLATGASQNVALSGGDGNWSATVGPFPASGGMPDSSSISISVLARDGSGREATASASSTLRKPSAC